MRLPLNSLLPPARFGLLRPADKQTKLEVTTLMGLIYPVYSEGLGLVLHSGGKEESVWHPRTPLVFPRYIREVYEKLQQPCPIHKNLRA